MDRNNHMTGKKPHSSHVNIEKMCEKTCEESKNHMCKVTFLKGKLNNSCEFILT